jgi:hypothetical protein
LYAPHGVVIWGWEGLEAAELKCFLLFPTAGSGNACFLGHRQPTVSQTLKPETVLQFMVDLSFRIETYHNAHFLDIFGSIILLHVLLFCA